MSKFETGDLVRSNLTSVYGDMMGEKEWYGIILGFSPEPVPEKFPVYKKKYKVKWFGGHTGWYYSNLLELISKSK